MNRRFNAVVFLALTTILNVILLFFYFLAFTGIVGLFLPVRSGWVAVTVWIGLFVASVTVGWFTYRWAFYIFRSRVDLEKYFDPNLFKGLF